MINKTSIEYAIATMTIATGEFSIRLWDLRERRPIMISDNATLDCLAWTCEFVDTRNGELASCDFIHKEILFYIQGIGHGNDSLTASLRAAVRVLVYERKG